MQLPTVLALAVLEDMLNKALDLDPATRLQLNQHIGRSILVNVQFPHLSILVFLDEGKVRLTPAEDHLSHEANATVTASSFDLIKQALNKEKVILQSGLQIEGDVFFLHELQKISHQIDIDWEFGLSQFVGDISASQIGQGVRSLFDFAKQAANAFLNNSSQFLREDAQILPKKWQVDDYIEEVQELRSDIERLEARIILLQQRSSPSHAKQNSEGF